MKEDFLDLMVTRRLDAAIEDCSGPSMVLRVPYYLYYSCPMLQSSVSSAVATRFSDSHTLILDPDADVNLWKDTSEQPELLPGPPRTFPIPLKDPRVFLDQATKKGLKRIIIVGPDSFNAQNLLWLSVLIKNLKYFPIACILVSCQEPSLVFKGIHFWIRSHALKIDVSNGLTTSESLEFIKHNLPENDFTPPKTFLSWNLLDKESACTLKEYKEELEGNLYNPLALFHSIYAYLKKEGRLSPELTSLSSSAS